MRADEAVDHWPLELSAATLAAAEVPLPALPTATQEPPEGHEMSEIALKFGGGAALVHRLPPLVEDKKTGADAPAPVAPPATQLVDDSHEIFETVADDAGKVTASNV